MGQNFKNEYEKYHNWINRFIGTNRTRIDVSQLTVYLKKFWTLFFPSNILSIHHSNGAVLAVIWAPGFHSISNGLSIPLSSFDHLHLIWACPDKSGRDWISGKCKGGTWRAKSGGCGDLESPRSHWVWQLWQASGESSLD